MSKRRQKNQCHLSQLLQQGQQDMICPDSLIAWGHSHCYSDLMWRCLRAGLSFLTSMQIHPEPENSLQTRQHAINASARLELIMILVADVWKSVRCDWSDKKNDWKKWLSSTNNIFWLKKKKISRTEKYIWPNGWYYLGHIASCKNDAVLTRND